MTIHKKGAKFELRSKKTGKLLGTHETKTAAQRQERKIQMEKAKRSGRKS